LLYFAFDLMLQETVTFSKHSPERPSDIDIILKTELISVRLLHVSSNFCYSS